MDERPVTLKINPRHRILGPNTGGPGSNILFVVVRDDEGCHVADELALARGSGLGE